MYRLLCAGLLVLTVPTFATAQAPSLKEARQRLLRGNVEEAITAYEALAKDPKQKPAAVLGLSQAYQGQGDYDRALAVVESALKGAANQPDLLARKAELLHLRGRWDEAEKAAETVLEADKQHPLARFVRAQVYRDRGDLKKADSEFRWFTRLYNDTDIKEPEVLLLVGLAAAEYSRWHKDLADQFEFIVNEICNGALKIDKDYWPAEVLAGMLLLEKYNRPDAEAAFDKALTINPSAPEALVGKGLLEHERMELKDAEGYAEKALKTNPKLPAALRLMADVHLFSGDVPAALKELERARAVNPRDERTLGRVAACLHLQRKQADFDALVKEVTKHNPTPGVFFHELGERLEERRRYEAAEGFYKKAVELHPRLAWPQNSLGMLYMRMGKEKEAGDVLTKAFELDPFNVRVSNTLKVLKHLGKYETIRTEHFELRYDPKNDKALAHYLAEFLEGVYADLARQFDYRPKGPILIEVFNTHEMFSGRTVALPDLHTIGACTGRMFAMVSPNGKRNGRPMTPFNWARVVRHELVHIFNLEQTHFLVPHWLTEGLAVINEGFPRPQEWNEMLLEKVPAGEVLNLDTIDLGFIRPRSPAEWHLAYCQSQIYVEYLKKQYGEKSVGEMLAAYGDGLDTGAAIARVCKVDKAEFEKGYRAFLDEVVRGIKSKPPEKAMTFTQLRDAHQKDPGDLDLKARLAEAYYGRDKGMARKLAKEVQAAQPRHALASYVLARLALAAGDGEEGLKLLEGGLDRNNPEPKVLKELGKLYYNASQFEKAADLFELARKAEPYQREWLVELARVYAQTGNRDKHIVVLEELVPTDADDFSNRLRLARMLTEAGRNDTAEVYARQALEINFKDADAQELYEKVLRAQNKKAEADHFREILEK
jgi:tetratricopeptide (TPR) repeat protein